MSEKEMQMDDDFNLIDDDGQVAGDEQQPPQLTQAELRASGNGWQPKEDWIASGGDPDQWIDAVRFNERGEFMGKIHSQNVEIGKMKKAMKELTNLYNQAAERAEERIKNQLLAEKAAAMEEQDFQKVVEVDEQIKEHDKKVGKPVIEYEDEEEASETPPYQEYYENWVGQPQNAWYSQDADAAETAQLAAVKYVKRNPGASPEKVFQHMEAQARRLHPEVFVNPNKGKAQEVSNPSGSPSNGGNEVPGGAELLTQLSAEQKQVGKTLIDGGAFKNMQEYAVSLKENGLL